MLVRRIKIFEYFGLKPLNPHAGSNVIVAGTAIFGSPDPEVVIATLKATVNSAQARLIK